MSGLAELSQQTLLYKILPAPEDRSSYNLMSVARYATRRAGVLSRATCLVQVAGQGVAWLNEVGHRSKGCAGHYPTFTARVHLLLHADEPHDGRDLGHG